MSSLLFWKDWVKEYRYLWYALSSLFLFSLCYLWYSNFRGEGAVINWQKLQEQKVVETKVHSFRLGPFELDIPGESYVILEYLNGSQMQPDVLSSYIYLSLFAVSLTFLIAIITTLPRIWFYVAAGIFIVLMVTLRFEVLGIFGIYQKAITIGIILLFVVPAFYFNQFRADVSFPVRVLTFTAIVIFLAVMIGAFAKEELPFYHLVITTFPSTLILSLLFIIIIAHEVFASFVYISTQGSSKSIQHLAILSTIYFVNLLLTLLHELGMIRFDFIYINLFLLLTVSSVLGTWGFRQRERVYENLFPFYPLGGLLFLSLGIVCFSTIAHQLANGNDAGVLVLRHAIIFTHAAYGLIFLLYLLSNFGQMLSDNAPVYKVLYNPQRMPYFTYRLAGFIATLAIIIYAGWREYVYNSFAAFYNTAGDFYSLLDDEDYARSFYEKASTHGFQNHKSNYVLSLMDASNYSFERAHINMEAANGKRPTIFSLTNAGNLYVRQGDLRKGVEEFKKNLGRTDDPDAILNNIGVAYTKLRNYDSAILYLSKARENDLAKTSAETNFFALTALELIPIQADSIYKTFNNPSSGTLSNVYAHAAAHGRNIKIDGDPLSETQLDLYTATLLNNYLILNAKTLDTVFTNRAYAIASDSINSNYSEALMASLAFAFYHQGNIAKALEILAEQVYLSQSYQGKFNYIQGLWALEQENPVLAASYFNFAETYAYKDAPFYYAIALTEGHKTREALVAWDTVAAKGDEDQKMIARNIKRLLSTSAGEAASLPDPARYQFCRYRITLKDSVLFNAISRGFTNDDYAAQAYLDYSKRWFEAGHVIPAIRYYQKTAGLKLTDKKLYEEIRFFELRLLASRGDLRGLASQINKGIEFTPSRFLEKTYYTALLNDGSGDTLNASKNFAILARYNPYYEEGVLAAANYYKKRQPQSFLAYNTLAEAIHVNNNSLPLLRAYYEEAIRVGLDEYAASTAERIRELLNDN